MAPTPTPDASNIPQQCTFAKTESRSGCSELSVLTWNAARLTPTHQLLLQSLLDDSSPDVVVMTETQLDMADVNSIQFPRYKTFPAAASKKVRVLVLELKF